MRRPRSRSRSSRLQSRISSTSTSPAQLRADFSSWSSAKHSQTRLTPRSCSGNLGFNYRSLPPGCRGSNHRPLRRQISVRRKRLRLPICSGRSKTVIVMDSWRQLFDLFFLAAATCPKARNLLDWLNGNRYLKVVLHFFRAYGDSGTRRPKNEFEARRNCC